jgi:hypothetical protein
VAILRTDVSEKYVAYNIRVEIMRARNNVSSNYTASEP